MTGDVKNLYTVKEFRSLLRPNSEIPEIVEELSIRMVNKFFETSIPKLGSTHLKKKRAPGEQDRLI